METTWERQEEGRCICERKRYVENVEGVVETVGGKKEDDNTKGGGVERR